MSMAVAESRKARCVELATKGVPYDQIASEVGYANRGTAWRVVNKALTERVDSAVDEYRQMELARLDALQESLWSTAMEGNVRSVDAILRIIDRRIRLLGLDQVTVRDEFPLTVVVDPADLVRWGIEATGEATTALG
jgi:orotate phosphoribosyltransferase-like protein